MKRWLLLIDLDGTMWDNEDISLLTPPFKKLNKDTIVDSWGVTVHLNNEMVMYIKWARVNHALVSTLSWNIYEKAYEALKTFGVTDLFDYITIEETYRKDLMIKKLLDKISVDMGIEFRPEEIVYVDDRDLHIDDIYKNIGPVYFIHYDITSMDSNMLIETTRSYLRKIGFKTS